ncbi:MAG: RNA polymerase-binding protein DksA [Rhizobacter sp.]|nr:RNA polymerase-binding protein DksA [Rhizobacter sp.]MBP6268375.1 RNA polymerase-binding protein DksA [Rhizobacter sp.]
MSVTRSPAKSAPTAARAEPKSKKAADKLPAKPSPAKKSPAPTPKASALPPPKRTKAPAKRAPATPASDVISAKAARSASAAEKPALNSMLKTPLKAADKEAAPVPAPAPVAAVAEATVAPAKAPRAKSAAKSRYGAPMPAAPLPPPTSRFADRFAPPRPPTRQMNNLGVDTPRVAPKADPKLANAWKTKAGKDLTEAEILAMPDSEYMSEKQLEFFRATLKKLKDDLLSNAGETTEHLREDTSIVPDPADRATIEEEHALELRTRDRERKLLKKIAQSLNRVESGEYGFCDETGEPIGLGRLIARPTATLSLEAQQRRELKQKMFGD